MKPQGKIKDVYRLSPMQEGMLYHYIQNKNSSNYLIQQSYRIQGNIDVTLAEKSFNELFKRHDVLKTSFVYEELEKPLQIVLRERFVSFYFFDAHSSGGIEEKESIINDYKRRDINSPFNLTKDSLMRLAFVHLSENTYELIWTYPHILLDGWSASILINEFFKIYNSALNSKNYVLPPCIQYREYIQWLDAQDKNQPEQYWSNYLELYNHQASIFNISGSAVNGKNRKMENLVYEIDERKTNNLKRLALKYNATLNTLLQSIWGVLLSKHCNRKDVVFGAVVSGRPAEIQGVESIVGLFINTIPVRVKYSKDDKFIDFLKKNQLEATDNLNHSYYSLNEIFNRTEIKSSLFNHLLVFENFPDEIELSDGQTGVEKNNENLTIQISELKIFDETNYDFTVTIIPARKLAIRFQFNELTYKRSLIENLTNQIDALIKQVLDYPDAKVSQLTLISSLERQKLFSYSTPSLKYPNATTIQELFEKEVEDNPDANALIFRDKIITYKELNNLANNLATYLRNSFNIRPEDKVGLFLHKSEWMMIGLLGVLKSGAAYIPIDKNLPSERIKYILDDSEISILLTLSDYIFNFDYYTGQLLALDLQFEKSEKVYHNPLLLNKPEDLAYIIYTSGSTGQPKGVQVEHRNIVNTLLWRKEYYKFGKCDVNLQIPSYSFDSSVEDIFSILISGGTLVIPEEDKRTDPFYLKELILRSSVTHMLVTPSLYKVLLKELREHLKGLKVVTVAGEPVNQDLVKQHYCILPSVLLINEYGPTENAVCSTVCLLKSHERVSIGKGISNVEVYILDDQLNLQPEEVIGEICVSGAGVSRGYWKKEELTKERFVKNPYSKNNAARLYKTGDLGRWLADGTIEFLGRKDDQIKIRGYRIELGEIEKNIKEYGDIDDVIVLAIDNKTGEKYLVGYLQSKKELLTSGVKDYLKKRLPEYMVPSVFIQIDSFPLTINGKIDKEALPKPEEVDLGLNYLAPTTSLEEKLVMIWQEIFQKERIGIEDDFFSIGGHSLIAVQLLSTVYKSFQIKISIDDIFLNTTIEKLSKVIEAKTQIKFEEIKPLASREYYQTSYSQRRLWVANELSKGSPIFNLPGAYIFKGELDIKSLERAFQKLIERHEVLRTIFTKVNGQPMQKVLSPEQFRWNLEYIDLRKLEDRNEEASLIANQEAIKGFDLENGPLLRCKIVQLEEARYLFLMTLHHIVSDGWSSKILVDEVFKFYDSFRKGIQIELPPLKIQYKDFAAWQAHEISEGNFEKSKAFWLSKLAGKMPFTHLPIDYYQPSLQTLNGDYINVEVKHHTLNLIRQYCVENKVSLYSFFLAIIKILVYRYTSQKDIVLKTPVAGRMHKDLENQIGFYMNIILLRTKVDPEDRFSVFLGKVHEETVKALEHQDYPFDLVIEDINNNNNNSNNKRKIDIPEFGFTWNKEQLIDLLSDDVQIEQFKIDIHTAKADFWIYGLDLGERVFFTFEYKTDLYRKETIELFAERFIKAIESVVDNKYIKIQDIALAEKGSFDAKDFDDSFNLNIAS
jgi:bacitracin synthase 3